MTVKLTKEKNMSYLVHFSSQDAMQDLFKAESAPNRGTLYNIKQMFQHRSVKTRKVVPDDMYIQCSSRDFYLNGKNFHPRCAGIYMYAQWPDLEGKT